MSFPSTATFRTGASFPVANVSTPPSVVTNAQKLSLSPSTPVGTKMGVGDGFVVSGFGDGRDGFYVDQGGGVYYRLPNDPDVNTRVDYTGTAWEIGGTDIGFVSAADGSEAFPWQANWSGLGVTLTHPAIQTLTAPDTSQGGVAVLGGTQDGVYAESATGSSPSNGKKVFSLLGSNDGGGFDGGPNIFWYSPISDYGAAPSSAGFIILDSSGGILYYNLDDKATPDLCTLPWLDANTNLPAPITVTSVSIAQLVAGARIGSTTYAVSGNANGRNVLSDVLGVALPIQWTGSAWENEAVVNTGNVAFPWLGSPSQSITQDNVASEANWIVPVDSGDSFFPAPPIHF